MTIGPEHPDHPGYQGPRPDPEQPAQQQWPTYGGPQQPGQPYGYGQYGAPYSPPVFAPKHPQSTTALVMGIVALAGSPVLCGLTLVLGPFAWAVGAKAKRQIAAAPGRYTGESEANIGMILGIISTVLLALAIIGLVLFIVFVAAVDDTSTSYSNT